MAEFFLLGPQVIDIANMRRHFERHPGDGHAVTLQALETLRELDSFLSPHWSRSNPVDVLADADAERFVRAVEAVSKDPGSDGLLAIIAPQGLADPTQAARHMAKLAHSTGKPILASWMGGDGVAEGTEILNTAGIPTFSYPDTAARAFTYMWRYTYNLRGLYETPALLEGPEPAVEAKKKVSEFVQQARSSGRTMLNEFEAKQLLASYGIPVVVGLGNAPKMKVAPRHRCRNSLYRHTQTSFQHNCPQDRCRRSSSKLAE